MIERPCRPRRILITGGAGFIGSALVRMILERLPGAEVVNFDALTYAASLSGLEDVLEHPRHRFVRGDIADRAAVRRAMDGCDCVINVAAESHVDRSIIDSSPFIRTNVLGTQVLLDSARELKVQRYLQVSTDEVYGSLSLDPAEPAFTEATPLNPSSPYAASKAAADLLVLAYVHTFGFPAMITRCSNNFGPRQFPEKVIPLFTINLMRGKRVPLYGDGLNVRDWIHVDDHCAAIIAALERGQAGRVYNVGASNEHPNVELTRMLLRLTGRDPSFIEHVTDRLGHDRRYAIDSTWTRKALGWEATRSQWPAALEDTVQWYRENQIWWESILSGAYREENDRLAASHS